ncbi:MAG: cyclic nucleotide-binding domain protein [Deltaproteobacteria bacterium]|nr:cyclic nucleotide-binding domain protein [Deltaproteobacteria bacterium]
MAEDKSALVDKIQKLTIKGEWDKVLLELQKLNIILSGKDLRVRMKIAEALARIGKTDDAVKEYMTVSDSYAESGFTVQAIAVNKLIVKLDPSKADVHKKLAEVHTDKGFAQAMVSKEQAAATVEEEKGTGKKPSVPRTPLFSDLTADELAYVSEQVEVLQVQAGSTLFKEGDPGDSLFIITHGEINILSQNSKGEEVEVARLNNGDFFGEFAFFSNSKRQADAVASSETELLELTRETLIDVTQKYPRVKEVLISFYKNRVVDKLMVTSQLFRSLGPKDRMQILQKLSYQTFEPGALIIQEGCTGDYLYLIKSGGADITTWRDDQEMLLATIGEGEFFGEISLVTGTPRTASVRARTAMETMKLSKADLDEVANRYPNVKKVIDDMIKKRVEDTIKIVLDMNTLWKTGLV